MTVIGAFAAVTAIPAISSSNPAELVFTWILPENEFKNSPYLTKICSCLYLGISSYFSCFPMVQIFCYITALLYESKYFLKRAYGSYGKTTFYYQWIVYAQYILLDREINRFCSHINPVIMLVAFGVNVVTTTVCLKFYRDLSLAMLIIFLVFDIVVWSATVVVHSLAVLPKEECEKFHVYWKSRLISKLAQRRLKACRRTGICIGQFFTFQRTALLNTWDQIVNMVVTLLLADQ